MEKLLATGKTKAIGVSNFNIRRLDELLSQVSIVPAVNQIEAHPYLSQKDLFQYCKDKNILIEAYSPLGNNQKGEPRTVDDPLVHEIGTRLGLDPGAVLYSWGVQRGTVVLPKSVTPSRIASNLRVETLSDDVMVQLSRMERHKRFNFPAHWGVDIFDEAVAKAARDAAPANKIKFTV